MRSRTWSSPRGGNYTAEFDDCIADRHVPSESQCGLNPLELISSGALTKSKEKPEQEMYEGKQSLNDGCHGYSPEVESAILNIARRAGRCDAKVWSRCDLSSGTSRGTNMGGPCWAQVLGRVLVRGCDQKILDCRLVGRIPRCLDHAKLPCGDKDLNTYLVYISDAWAGRGIEGTRTVRK